MAKADEIETKPPRFVLEKNFGFIDGREHLHWTAGTEFDPVTDADMIAFFHRHGASIKLI